MCVVQYTNLAPDNTYVSLWTVYGEFYLTVTPPPMTNWRIYAYKVLVEHPDVVELKYNVTPSRDLPGYNDAMITAQIMEYERVYVPRDVYDYQLDTLLNDSNALKTTATWALHEIGGNWSAGFVVTGFVEPCHACPTPTHRPYRSMCLWIQVIK